MIARLVLLALLAGVLMPASASAHATLVRSSPSDQLVLKTQPREVSLEFSEGVDLGPSAIKLLDGAGAEIKTPAAAKHGRGGAATAVLQLPPGLAEGTYVVTWLVVSSDSHPVSGAFSFSVGAPTAVVFSRGRRRARRSGRSTRSAAGSRSPGSRSRSAARSCCSASAGGGRGRWLVWSGVGALIAGSVVVFLMQGPYASGGSLADALDPSSISFSLGTRFGQAVVARIVLTAAFALLLARGLRVPAALCGVALIFTWTLVDHSRTGVQTWLGVPAASVHLLAMALWFGGLVVVLVCGEAAPTARFSRVALACFGALGVTGVYLAYRQSGELGALPATVFGRLLLVKTGVVIAILALAYFSRRAVQRRSTPRRTVAGEAFLGIAVLGLTAVLVNTAPARVDYVDPIHTTVAGPGGRTVEIRVDPAKQGENVADVYLMSGGKLIEVPELTARLRPKDGSSGPARRDVASRRARPLRGEPAGRPLPRRLGLRLQIRTSEIDESDLDVPLKIR